MIDRQELARRLAHQIAKEATKGEPIPSMILEIGASIALKAACDIVSAGAAYLVVERGKAIMCFTCGLVSHNPNDVANRYCGFCHTFHESGEIS